MSKLTEAIFSMQCSFIAKNASAWAGDILTFPEHYNREADPKTVARFTDEIARGLIVWTNGQAAPPRPNGTCWRVS